MDYKQAIASLMAGEPVQYRPEGTDAEWENLSEVSRGALGDIVRGLWLKSEFRLKPRTVRIGSLEVEAPVLEPVEGQTLWWYDSGADEPIASEPSASEAAKGEWFASASAATAAYEAFLALLRGEA